MSNSSWHGGKGDKSRTSDVNKFSRNMEKIYEKKTWQFWAVWEGLNTEKMDFDVVFEDKEIIVLNKEP